MQEPDQISAQDPELFVRLYAANERSIRAFLFNLLPGVAEVDEVMQEVSLVLWKKFSSFDPNTEFLRWAHVVARYEVLMYRRKKARDRHVFDEDLIMLLSEEYEDETEPLERERRALDGCLLRLPVSDRRLLMACYAKDMKIKEMALRLGKTPTSLYKKLNRLRESLLDCIDRSARRQEISHR